MTQSVGAFIPRSDVGGAELTSDAQRIEELGFDWVSCGEHVLFTGPITNAFVTLAHIGAVTTRIELLSGVTIAPLYGAGLLAKLVTSLDITSGGRFNFGVGVGGEFPAEFAACGVAVSERGRRTDEALAVLQFELGIRLARADRGYGGSGNRDGIGEIQRAYLGSDMQVDVAIRLDHRSELQAHTKFTKLNGDGGDSAGVLLRDRKGKFSSG